MLSINKIRHCFFVAATAAVVVACANRGQGPQGGPKDEVPPRLVKSTPANGARHVDKKRIDLDFDENIVLKEIAKNVIISPPQRSNPEIRAYGRRVAVVFGDTLQTNTTYSINFGDAVTDNNEGNVLPNFVFSFATGADIDTLQVSGTLINAQDLNPVKGVIVGIQSHLSDSAFARRPFDRITKSGDEGKFTVHNVKENRYRVYALNDQTRDYMHQQGEGAAFTDSIFSTSVETYLRQDTVWKDSVTVDTVHVVPAVRYLPNNIVLKYFEDDAKRQYLVKSERPEPHRLALYFNTVNKQLPDIRPLNFDWNNRMLMQKNERMDSITYWLTDSTLIGRDTLTLQVNYLKSDSAMQLRPQTDTVHLFTRRAASRVGTGGKGDGAKRMEFLQVTSNLSSAFDVYKRVMFTFGTPIKYFQKEKIRLVQVVDTVLTPVECVVEKADSVGMRYTMVHPWKPETVYRVEVDSAAFVSVYDRHNNTFKGELKLRSLEEYAALKIDLTHHDSTAVLQVVDKGDKVIRTVRAKPGGTLIPHLEPGDYYVRMFLDNNGNNRWDTGSWREKRQPETVFYYPKKLTLIKNWEFEETWDHTLVPLLEQKPSELKKTVDPTAAAK